MNDTFKVELIKYSTLTQLPNAWNKSQYIDLLEIMDYSDTNGLNDNDLKETCLILLSENKPEEAAQIVINYVLGSQLNTGQINNLCNEVQEEKMWEEYPDLAFHESFFNITQLLYEAYNGKFPHPEAVQFKIKLSTEDNNNFDVFNHQIEIPILRLLVKGMPENTLIKRLYHAELDSEPFGEAKDIIWQIHQENLDDNSKLFTIISSLYWFKDLKYIEPFEATTFND